MSASSATPTGIAAARQLIEMSSDDPRAESLTFERSGIIVVHGGDVVSGEVLVHAPDGLLHAGNGVERIGLRAHHEDEVVCSGCVGVLSERQIPRFRGIAGISRVVNIPDDADNRQPRPPRDSRTYALADSVLLRPEMPRSFFAENCHRRTALVILRSKRAATEQRNSHGLEQFGTDEPVMKIEGGVCAAGVHFVRNYGCAPIRAAQRINGGNRG